MCLLAAPFVGRRRSLSAHLRGRSNITGVCVTNSGKINCVSTCVWALKERSTATHRRRPHGPCHSPHAVSYRETTKSGCNTVKSAQPMPLWHWALTGLRRRQGSPTDCGPSHLVACCDMSRVTNVVSARPPSRTLEILSTKFRFCASNARPPSEQVVSLVVRTPLTLTEHFCTSRRNAFDETCKLLLSAHQLTSVPPSALFRLPRWTPILDGPITSLITTLAANFIFTASEKATDRATLLQSKGALILRNGAANSFGIPFFLAALHCTYHSLCRK